MVKVSFEKFETITDDQYQFAVICANYHDKWIFCRHKQRATWEIPGGHREANEAIIETAKRELFEETGAKKFTIIPISAYCVENNCDKTHGMLFLAIITELVAIPHDSEIGDISLFDTLPDDLTYPQIQPYLHEFALNYAKPCYSYVMGIGESILSLNSSGFDIRRDGENYTVTFPMILSSEWEKYISKHLKSGYWNEYFVNDKIVFLFHIDSGIQRYEVSNYDHNKVLKLCEKLCECKFNSLKEMLLGNWFYHKHIGETR